MKTRPDGNGARADGEGGQASPRSVADPRRLVTRGEAERATWDALPTLPPADASRDAPLFPERP